MFLCLSFFFCVKAVFWVFTKCFCLFRYNQFGFKSGLSSSHAVYIYTVKSVLTRQRLLWHSMGTQQRGPGVLWPTQNFGWVGHNAFGPTNNWPVCSLILRKISRIGATRHKILRLKCTNSLSPMASPQTPFGECCPPNGDLLTVFTGHITKGTEKRRRGERKEK